MNDTKHEREIQTLEVITSSFPIAEPLETHSAELVRLDAGNDPFRRRKIGVGMPLFVDYLLPGGTRIKGDSRLLGWRVGHWLMASTPLHEGNELHYGYHSSLQVRFVLDGRIYGFGTRQLMDQQEPFGLIFLAYPTELERYSFRESPRLGVVLACMVESGERRSRAYTLDISEGGCLLTFDADPGIESEVLLSFTLPTGQIVKGLRGVTRRMKSQPKGVRMGIQFPDDADANRRMIADYVTLALGLLDDGMS